jgi:outer membrane protein TolC
MNKNTFWFIFFLVGFQTDFNAQNILDRYVQQAIESNLSLKEKKMDIQVAQKALEIAKTYFYPSISMETQYTLASGGRTISIPVGDLVNPVYLTLNQLTNSNQFPTIENVEEQFFPNNFYDARIRTTFPILQPDLKLNLNTREKEIEIAEIFIERYKKDLIQDVKLAYYNILKITESLEIYKNSIQLLESQQKITQSLIAQGVTLPFQGKRIETELISLENQLQNAENQLHTAQAYFNFLLNQPFNQVIEIEKLSIPSQIEIAYNPDQREEIKLLNQSSFILQEVYKRKKSYATPQISWFLDLGTQGFDFEVNRNSFFYLTGLQIQMPIYQFKRNYHQIDIAQLNLNQTDFKIQQTSKSLELSFLKAKKDLESAHNLYQSSLAQIETSQQYYSLTAKAFKEGVASYIEYLDALNQWTIARIQSNLLKYEIWIAYAKYERQQ